MPAPGHSPSLCPDPFLDNPAAVLHHLHLALDKHPSAHSGMVGAAPACPSLWQGGSLWLRKGLHRCCCSKGTAALQTRLCWQPPRPQACIVKEVWKEKLAPACAGPIGQGDPHTSPGSRGHHPMGSTYTLLPTMPWVRCSHPGVANRASPGCQQWGWKMGVMKHRCISLPCSHMCSNGCCHPKAASLVLAATGRSPRRVAGAEVELGSRQQQYTQQPTLSLLQGGGVGSWISP